MLSLLHSLIPEDFYEVKAKLAPIGTQSAVIGYTCFLYVFTIAAFGGSFAFYSDPSRQVTVEVVQASYQKDGFDCRPTQPLVYQDFGGYSTSWTYDECIETARVPSTSTVVDATSAMMPYWAFMMAPEATPSQLTGQCEFSPGQCPGFAYVGGLDLTDGDIAATQAQAIAHFSAKFTKEGICERVKANSPFNCRGKEDMPVLERISLSFSNCLAIYSFLITVFAAMMYAQRSHGGTAAVTSLLKTGSLRPGMAPPT
eukprot:CAMPEP_0174938344 /NCGR_PEP_ID=MMETSP1355-20121228/63210_1 /TAXON_ID=464990 /ORGANISM="Hemiselmis tepida, Strain CCMP443" /LENGTH=255 /DNA_ID=CAMNT_0016185263 /DNA_START=28 /DNA_END=792 /DNA_ORIENTATION=+